MQNIIISSLIWIPPMISGIYTAPTPNSKLPSKANPKNFGMLQWCIKLQKSWKMGEKMVKKSIIHWDFGMRILTFLKNYNS